MSSFLQAVSDFAFLRNALAAGLLVSVSCGVIGTYVFVRRIAVVAGGIAHSVLAGLGAAHWLRVARGHEWADPLAGALAAALLAAMIIGWVRLRQRQHEDTVINALWAVGMATGILFITATPGYSANLMSYLFGNILLITTRDLWMIGALDATIIGLVLLFHRQLQAVCFDEEFSRLRGVRVELVHFLLLGLTALTVVLLVSVVGIVLVIALLTLPAALARLFAGRMVKMMFLAGVFCMLFTVGGLALSWGPDLPPGAVTVMLAGGSYFLANLLRGGPASKNRFPPGAADS